MYGSNSYTLGANVENLNIYASSDDIQSAAYGGGEFTIEDAPENYQVTFTGVGNDIANVITGIDEDGHSAFALYGNGGNDKLISGANNDILNGGSGKDTMVGGAGNDIYFVDNIGDVVTETTVSEVIDNDEPIIPTDIDIVFSTVSYTLGANIEVLALGADSKYSIEGSDDFRLANINGTGNALSNILIGNDGKNILNGKDGDDILLGGNGNDNLIGGNGDDQLIGGGYGIVRTLDVELTDNNTLDGGAGNDTLYGGYGADVMIGGIGDDELSGGNGKDTLTGGAGNDELDGGNDADRLDGGAGNDKYFDVEALDTIIDVSGIDSVYASEQLIGDLAAGIENLYMSYSATTGRGNALNNLIEANNYDNILFGLAGNDIINGLDGNDQLDGGDGNDILDGGEGYDLMRGGNGNDTYLIDSDYDVAVEINGTATGGKDTVISLVDIDNAALNQFIENVTLIGTEDLTAYGNSLANTLIGNDSGNNIYGQGGNDTIDGGLGDDALFGQYGNDSIVGGDGNDFLLGDDGDDTLNGGLGNDVMYGGDGNDTYIVDSQVL